MIGTDTAGQITYGAGGRDVQLAVKVEFLTQQCIAEKGAP